MQSYRRIPFRTHAEAGVRFVDAEVDAAFKRAIIAGAPEQVRHKFQEAFANGPDPKGRMHAQRYSNEYFGYEMKNIIARITPLLNILENHLHHRFRMPGMFDWLEITGFGDWYQLIKAFDLWADMVSTRAIGTETVH